MARKSCGGVSVSEKDSADSREDDVTDGARSAHSRPRGPSPLLATRHKHDEHRPVRAEHPARVQWLLSVHPKAAEVALRS